MLPTSIRKQLNGLRFRERSLAIFWAFARGLAAIIVFAVLACLLDWTVDLYRDTPRWLRFTMLGVGWVVSLGTLLLLLLALIRNESDDALALRIEEKHPRLRHRLISAVQLNREDAKTQGMSPELIDAVTRQAAERCQLFRFTDVADHRRLKWGLSILVPLLLMTGLLVLFFPETVRALVARHFLANREIPRRVTIESERALVWPAGEEGELRFRVQGTRIDERPGVVNIQPEQGPTTRHDLVFSEYEEWVCVARIPPSDIGFSFHARFGDGRTRLPGYVRYEPRPVVQRIDAWVQWPVSLGTRPENRPYEDPQKAGDILYRLPGSKARLEVRVQKSVIVGIIELFSGEGKAEKVVRTLPLQPLNDGDVLSGTLDLRPEETSYRIKVRDEYDFWNSEPPRRVIRQGMIEQPRVDLLPEVFSREGDTGPAEDREVEGIPVLLGQRFRIDYQAFSRYGLTRAQLRYRVVPRLGKKDEDGAVKEEEFLTLLLGGPKSPEEFRLGAQPDPEQVQGTEARGRYDCSVAGLSDGKGGTFDIKAGDRVQFYVEVYSKADPEGKPGRSAVREKEVVELREYLAWLEKKEDLKEKTRQLEEKQRGTKGKRE